LPKLGTIAPFLDVFPISLPPFNIYSTQFNSRCDAQNWAASSQPASFAPTALDTDNWAASIAALGAKEAVLTAKHGCGFAIWPTTAMLPDGSPYPYRVPEDMDVLARFSASMAAKGIGHGVYVARVCAHEGVCARPCMAVYPHV